MAQTLEDRSARLFARAADIAHLCDRARDSGLTAIIAGPQMGKSWLLTEVARERSSDPEPALVGFAEAAGGTPDLLLRAVLDLYQRWLENASYREQFLRVWQQQRGQWLPGVAEAMGKIAGELPGVGKLLGGVVDQALSGLLAANASLKSGGLTLPPLQYEQARDLVRAVADISGRNIVLCLDAWEYSTDPREAAELLGVFVDKVDTWPRCHIFLTTRDEPEAIEPLKRLAASVSGTAELYYLADFAPDAGEAARMTAFLNADVAATKQVSTATLVSLIDGCPGVIGRWTSNAQRDTMHTEADLARIAGDAQAFRFSDLEDRLDALKDDKRVLALRLAVVPKAASREGWDALRATLLDLGGGKTLDEAGLDDLQEADVLEATDPPSFGHAKRYDAALDWFSAHRPTLLRQQTGCLARALGAQVNSTQGDLPETIIVASALRDMADQALNAGDPWPAALCCAASTLFGKPVKTVALRVPDWLERPGIDLTGARLAAMGLVNAIYFAVQAGAAQDADALLDTLGRLARRMPEDVAVRTQLLNGLGHRYDLATLRKLWPALRATYDEDVLRDVLARALFDAFEAAREQEAPSGASQNLDELRRLVAANPLDDAAQMWLCRALYNALRGADEAGDGAGATMLLAEIQTQADASPTDPDIVEVLARALYQLGSASTRTTDVERAGLILRLQALAKAHLDNALIARMVEAALRNAVARKFGPSAGAASEATAKPGDHAANKPDDTP